MLVQCSSLACARLSGSEELTVRCRLGTSLASSRLVTYLFLEQASHGPSLPVTVKL